MNLKVQILNLLADAIFRMPEQRVMQIVFNALDQKNLARNVITGEPRDVFYVEDEQLAEALRDYRT